MAGHKPPINPDRMEIIIGKATDLKSATGEMNDTIPNRLDNEEIAFAAQNPRATPKIPPTKVMNNALKINIWITKFRSAPIPLKIFIVGA